LVYADVDPASIDFATLYAERYPPAAFLPQRARKVAKSHRELALLEQTTAGRRLLDVGCSYGFFLDTAQRRGWSVAGVELSTASASFARATYGLDVYTGLLADAPYDAGTFDVVTIRHVLEHVPNPAHLIAEAHTFLRPGGLILVAVPNLGSLAARLLGPQWWWIDPPTHLFYFTHATLARLLTQQGFESIAWRTERGDDETLAFYMAFALNRRLGIARRLRSAEPSAGAPSLAVGADQPAAGGPHPLWAAVRRIGEGLEVLTWPIGKLADRAGLGAELLILGHARRVALQPTNGLRRGAAVPDPAGAR
jgi:2-polyprenyl-3-methyl-5-hydroxy-6-metoxy-1,4-benzoquinol methylase